ncbi:MAG: HTTM domain-containing protein [Myxococcota bacterium]|nr:HTTM domain-containing protein [Myxococcota bacterium]
MATPAASALQTDLFVVTHPVDSVPSLLHRAAIVTLRDRIPELFAFDLRSLGLFRIGLGLLMLADCIYRAADVEAFWSDAGIRPHGGHMVLAQAPWTPFQLTGEVWFPIALLVGMACAALCIVTGWRWRIGVAGCWFVLQSMNLRNGLPYQVADGVHVLLLMWSMFLPLGERWVLGRGRPPNAPAHARSIVTVLFILQLLWIYIIPGSYKAVEPKWTQGSILIEAAFIDAVATGWLEALLHVPWLLELFARMTPWFELFAPLLLLVPWKTGPLRTALVAVFVAFHVLGIGMMLELGLVPYTLALCWLPILPGWFWQRIGVEGTAGTAGTAGRTLGLPRLPSLAIGIVGFASFVPSAELRLGATAPIPGIVRKAWRQTGFQQRRFSLWTRPAGNRHYMIAARLADGRAVELHHRVPLDWENPPPAPRNNHWYKTFQKLQDLEWVRHAVAVWHVREWQRDHDEGPPIEHVEVVVRRTPWMAPTWWTSGQWEHGMPEPTEYRSLYRVRGHGDDLQLVRRHGEADWTTPEPG